jgi:hypothetical protein
MAQRTSEYERIPGDLYVTPDWAYRSLIAVEPWASTAWDCCPVNSEFDFLECSASPRYIATNPPFNISENIIRHALELTKPHGGAVAMLLPHAWDCAKRRVDLFKAPPFKRKWAITRRIRWANLPQKTAGPSMNHSWFIWDHQHMGPATMRWLDGHEVAASPVPSLRGSALDGGIDLRRSPRLTMNRRGRPSRFLWPCVTPNHQT